MTLTEHASNRLAQRAISVKDIDIVNKYGQARNRSGGAIELVITEKAASYAIDLLKAEMKKIEKMKNKSFIIDGEIVITAFHSHKRYLHG